ncbi:PAS domain-containing sensor histidine kinase [Cryobacterium frigoriphilum]|uniref:histidine kinase n=1 Tax=Cryobacterium frigoriphilum TaxID=1259150 RepID=A0A4R8ZU23_9MICO|nr:PAS domain-containing sensor histidine kinase [Cryobacterium frigoriphilum]TFD45775.1 PAS domain-containing sensor histidine kinase [Cryobacterium frigoriphilum]
MTLPIQVAPPRRRHSVVTPRVERSVFLSQLLLAGAMLLLVAVATLVDPLVLADPQFFAGLTIIFVMTGVAAAVPWRRIDKRFTALLPVIDIVGLALARDGQPLSGVTLLLVFPVIWMSTHFGKAGAVGGVALSAVLIWLPVALGFDRLLASEVSRLAVVPIMLSFVAAMTYATTHRAAAQRVLLTQQADLFETALRRSKRQRKTLDEIFDAVDFGVVGFDRARRPTFINRAQRELLSRFGVLDGQPTTEIVYMDDQRTAFASTERPYDRALRGDTVDRLTVWIGDAGQQQAALLISARPVLDDHGDFDGGVMVVRDVTQELRLVKARDDLVASVSHELRTPLTSILGYLELVLDDDRRGADQLDADSRRMLGLASKNADRLLVLVAELLTAASDTRHTLALRVAPCELSSIVTDAIESLTPLAAERQIVFETGVLPVVALEADAFRLRQVVDNVFSNAIKYNVLAGRITVLIEATDAAVELRVTDTGRGMTDEEQLHLFDRFYRADSVRGSSVHGYGLGLSISRDIVRQHGGDLRLESRAGRGATAIVSLPLRR